MFLCLVFLTSAIALPAVFLLLQLRRCGFYRVRGVDSVQLTCEWPSASSKPEVYSVDLVCDVSGLLFVGAQR